MEGMITLSFVLDICKWRKFRQTDEDIIIKKKCPVVHELQYI